MPERYLIDESTNHFPMAWKCLRNLQHNNESALPLILIRFKCDL